MEDLKSVYAAQLAICEIVDAGSSIPGNCKSIKPKQHVPSGVGFGIMGKTNHGRDNAATTISKSHLIPCLQSLESRPQHWTSYSNNRQNAVVMCQAARINIEKGD